MNRSRVIKVLIKAMSKGDVGIFAGRPICAEAINSDRPGNLYLSRGAGAVSMAVGMAMSVERRVFVFVSDEHFLMDLGELAHAASSKCDNLYVVLLVTGNYSLDTTPPTIYDTMPSMHGVLFNMGFIVHDYRRNFENNKNPVKEIRATLKKVRGPLAVIVRVANKVSSGVDIDEKKSIRNITKFIKDKSISPYVREDILF